RNEGSSRNFPALATTSIAGALVIAAWAGLSGHLQSRDSPALELASLTGQLAEFSVALAEDGPDGARSYEPGYRGSRQALRLHSAQAGAFAWIGAYEHQDEAAEMIQHANSVRPRTMSDW